MAPWALTTDARRERERIAAWKELGTRPPAEIFPAPAPGVEVEVVRTRTDVRHEGDRVETLRFRSPYVTAIADLREDYPGTGRNAVAWAEHWRHGDEPRPTLAVIHGFGASHGWFNRTFFELPWFFGLGYDVLLFTLPFHGARRSPGVPMNGLEMFAGGITRVNEVMRHAIHDFRVFVDHLEAQGVDRLGVTGLSLGGYTTALLAATEPRLHFAIPNAPVTEMASLVRGWFPAGPVVRAGLGLLGVSGDDTSAALAVHSPLTHAPLLPRDRLMIIGGLGDRLAPPEQAEALWEHWGRPRLHWDPGNHVVHVLRSGYLREMRDFMVRAGCAPPRRGAARVS